MAGWDESKHPRHPKGGKDGGRFAPDAGGDHASASVEEALSTLGYSNLSRLMGEPPGFGSQTKYLKRAAVAEEVARIESTLVGGGFTIASGNKDFSPEGEAGPWVKLKNDASGDEVTVGSAVVTGENDWAVTVTHRNAVGPVSSKKARTSSMRYASDCVDGELLTFASLKGADIFSAGKWNGKVFTEDDLDNIVKSFEFFALAGRVPLKFGHNTEQPLTDGQPALGWVQRIWREGKKLKADFSDVPGVLWDAIKAGRYKFISVELLRDVNAGTRVVPLVLDAVALLGADVPAVGTLNDLQALTMSARHTEYAERLSFTQSLTKGDEKHMAEDNTDLKAQLEEMQRQLALANAKATQNEEKYTRLDADVKKKEVEQHRTAIKNMLEDAVRDKRIQSSARERFMRRFRIDTDDAGVMLIPLSDVESYIRENPNPFVPKGAAVPGGDPNAIPVGGLPDRELRARAIQLCRSRGQDPGDWQKLQAASIDLMRSDPHLAERYRTLPDDHADGKYEDVA